MRFGLLISMLFRMFLHRNGTTYYKKPELFCIFLLPDLTCDFHSYLSCNLKFSMQLHIHSLFSLNGGHHEDHIFSHINPESS